MKPFYKRVIPRILQLYELGIIPMVGTTNKIISTKYRTEIPVGRIHILREAYMNPQRIIYCHRYPEWLICRHHQLYWSVDWETYRVNEEAVRNYLQEDIPDVKLTWF